jgi:hypothetical protein
MRRSGHVTDPERRCRPRPLTEREDTETCLLIGHYQCLASAIGGPGIQLEMDA